MDSNLVNVLIVDDERAVCDLLHEELSEHGCACAEALDGITALNKLAAQHFEVVLLDIKLPVMSGMEVLREIGLHYASTATIVITALNDVDTAVKAMRLGASDYVVKPFDLGKVIVSVDTAIATALELSLASKHANEMDAIAFGVEQRRQLIDGHSKYVTQTTVEIARRLGVPEREIRNWAENKLRLDVERKRSVAHAIEKLKQSPLAQSLIGMSEWCLYLVKPEERRN